MFKRFLGLFISLLMLLALVPVGAISALPADLIPIHEVNVLGFDIPPFAGEDTSGHLTCWVGNDEGVTYYDNVQWYKNGQPFSGVYTMGSVYSVGITLEAEPGYYFAPDCVICINSKASYVDPQYSGVNSDGTLCSVRSVEMEPRDGVTYIDEIHINGLDYPPVAGEFADDHVALTLPEDAPYFFYSADDIAWYDEIEDNDEFYHEAFRLGRLYSLFVPVGLLYGYQFAPEVTIYINGRTDLVSQDVFNFSQFLNFYTIPFECVAGQELPTGDADGNGTVNANDALLVLRAALGLETLSPAQQARADADGSGTVDANDAVWILRRSLGLI